MMKKEDTTAKKLTQWQQTALAEQVTKTDELEKALQAKTELLSASEQDKVALLSKSSEAVA